MQQPEHVCTLPTPSHEATVAMPQQRLAGAPTWEVSTWPSSCPRSICAAHSSKSSGSNTRTYSCTGEREWEESTDCLYADPHECTVNAQHTVASAGRLRRAGGFCLTSTLQNCLGMVGSSEMGPPPSDILRSSSQ